MYYIYIYIYIYIYTHTHTHTQSGPKVGIQYYIVYYYILYNYFWPTLYIDLVYGALLDRSYFCARDMK